MLIHGRLESSLVNGPGNRAVLWTAGCSLGCKGCWNPDTHLFDTKKDVDLFQLEAWILGLKDIEGVTISGGEPMQQAPAVWMLMDMVKRSRPDLSFGMYTGYSTKELEEGRWKWKSAIDASWVRGSAELWNQVNKHLDFAILGRYNQLVQLKTSPLLGSSNQEIKFFTERYSQKDLSPQSIEFTVDEKGITVTGFPVGMHKELDRLLGDDEQGEVACV
jgi:anaerobic ribonucleoside-triphosphate reductase activating protein